MVLSRHERTSDCMRCGRQHRSATHAQDAGRWPSIAAVGLAFATQAGLLRAQSRPRRAGLRMAFAPMETAGRPLSVAAPPSATSETLKTSDRIVLRVDAGRRIGLRRRLRAATYNVYAGGTWTAPGQVFTPVAPVGSTWIFAPDRGRRVRISAWLGSDRRCSRCRWDLPAGSLNVAGMQRNALGAVRIERSAGHARVRRPLRSAAAARRSARSPSI